MCVPEFSSKRDEWGGERDRVGSEVSVANLAQAILIKTMPGLSLTSLPL